MVAKKFTNVDLRGGVGLYFGRLDFNVMEEPLTYQRTEHVPKSLIQFPRRRFLQSAAAGAVLGSGWLTITEDVAAETTFQSAIRQFREGETTEHGTLAGEGRSSSPAERTRAGSGCSSAAGGPAALRRVAGPRVQRQLLESRVFGRVWTAGLFTKISMPKTRPNESFGRDDGQGEAWPANQLAPSMIQN